MADPIRICSAWRDAHDRPVYTLAEGCPRCGAPSHPSGPAAFNPEDPYGAYRRALKRRHGE